MKPRRTSLTIRIVAIAGFLSSSIASVAFAGSMISGSDPDGLVYVVANDDGMELWRARLGDKARQRVSSTPDQEERWPVWSANAKRIAYVARNTIGLMKMVIKTLDIESGEESGIGLTPDFIQRIPTWSPDGKFIAHTFRFPSSKKQSNTNSGTAIVDLAKETRVVVARIEAIRQHMQSLDYSSDGTKIVSVGKEQGKLLKDGLWILRSGTNPKPIRQIPRGEYGSPRFTRDNQSVVFDIRTQKARKRNVMMTDLTGRSRPRQIASRGRSDDFAAAPSPTRDEIMFVSDRDGSPDLFLVDLKDGSVAVNLTRNSGDADIDPVWSPDGERIAYVVVPESDHTAKTKNHAAVKIRVIDRKGDLLFETAGVMPSWMPAWTGDLPVASYLEKGAAAAAVQH